MAYGRRRPFNKGKKCKRFKRVRMRGVGMVRRCASYGRAAATGRRGRRRRRGFRPYNKGLKCREYGINRLGRRTCRSYGKVYGGKYKNRRRSRPGSALPSAAEVDRMMNQARRTRIEHEESGQAPPAWWAT